MTLADLEARLIRRKRFDDGGYGWEPVEMLADAQGVQFLCPGCFAKNKGPRGTHLVLCWSRSRGIPDDASPGPGRWKLEGTCLADLTLNVDPPSQKRSVKLDCWHGFVTKGIVSNA